MQQAIPMEYIGAALLSFMFGLGETAAFIAAMLALTARHRGELDRERSERKAEKAELQSQLNVLFEALSVHGTSPVAPADYVRIWQVVRSHFSKDEINSLATELELEPENLEGETRDERAASLVKAARHRNRLVQLREIIIRDRPQAGIYGII